MYLNAVYATAVALELEVNIPKASGLRWVRCGPAGCPGAPRGGVVLGQAALLDALRRGVLQFTQSEWDALDAGPPRPNGRAVVDERSVVQ